MIEYNEDIYTNKFSYFIKIVNKLIPCNKKCTLQATPIVFGDDSRLNSTYDEKRNRISISMCYRFNGNEEAFKEDCIKLAKAYYLHLEKHHYKLTHHDAELAEEYAKAVWDVFYLNQQIRARENANIH